MELELDNKIREIAEASKNTKSYMTAQFNEYKSIIGDSIDDEGILGILRNKFLLGEKINKMIEKSAPKVEFEKDYVANPFDGVDLTDRTYPEFMKIESGITYKLELIEDEDGQFFREHTGGNFPGTQWLWSVSVLGAKPKPSQETKQDKDGAEIMKFAQVGKKYTMAIRKRAMQSLQELWVNEGFGNEPPTITMKRTGTGYQTRYFFKVV